MIFHLWLGIHLKWKKNYAQSDVLGETEGNIVVYFYEHVMNYQSFFFFNNMAIGIDPYNAKIE